MTHQKSKFILDFQKAVALAGIALLGACGRSDPNSSSDEGLKIGTLFPVTGDLAPMGQLIAPTLPLLVDRVNRCGGANGKPVELVSADDETDPNKGNAAMTKLAEVDRVSAVVGGFASSVSQAAVDIAVRNKIMMVSPASTSSIFTERAKKGDFKGFWARTAPSDTYQARALAKLARDKGLKRVSTVAINNDYGVEFEKAFVATFKQLGGIVVNEQKPTRYDPRTVSFNTEAAATFKGKPDGVAAVLYAESGSLFLKAAYEMGLTQNVQLLLADGVKSDDFARQVGKTTAGRFIIEGAIGTAPGADGKALNALTQLWKTKNNTLPGAYVPQTWDAGALLILAAQAAKSNTGEAISKELRNVSGGPGEEVTDVCQGLALLKAGKKINYQGASGNVDIDENGDVSGTYDVWKVGSDGKIEVTDKVSAAK
ncbi:ABC transporter substrate-binding protein [Altericista sp. CCNU0014]|uniref:ABC transporter substrate-binding protein n=1 Tax=Altericista sp. CCNU0014 TaxID=3082949 RepID=UPI00384D3FCB